MKLRYQHWNFINVIAVSVGNKIDESAELREVTHAEGQAQAAEWGVQFMETSAKTNHNVTELFQVCYRKWEKSSLRALEGGK